MASAGERHVRECEEAVKCAICLDRYEDPRNLSCSHTFCLQCLQMYQKGQTTRPCPQCNTPSVPEKKELINLERNTFAVQLVALLQQQEKEEKSPCQNQTPVRDFNGAKSASGRDKHSDNYAGATELFRNLISGTEREPSREPEPSRERQASSSSSSSSDSIEISDLVNGLGNASGLLSMMAEHLLSQLAVTTRNVNANTNSKIHLGITCDRCSEDNIGPGNRYKCGICADYDLCEHCFPTYINFHNPKHMFVKLKTRATRRVGMGPVLTVGGRLLAQSMRHGDRVHQHVQCDHCGRNNFTGIRFKCGICRDYDLCQNCEPRSQDFHNSSHTFVVIPFAVQIVTTESIQMKIFH